MSAALAIAQWSALSERRLRSGVRGGDLLLVCLAPTVFFVCFYVPLRRALEPVTHGYAQYLVPVVAVLSMFFVSLFVGDYAAREVVGGMAARLRSMPVNPWVPVAARVSAGMVWSAVGLGVAVLVGSLSGFRFHGALAAAGFVALALAFGAGVMIATDALGTYTRNPELSGTVLFGPWLLFLLASTGLVPAQGFPGWIQPFVRNQPISQLATALRGLADGRFPPEIAVCAGWILGIIVAGSLLAVRAEGRRA